MIYKFIDNNDQEITVNSLSSLQALVDSETIKENTKVKAGLRGKWIKASSVEGLNFEKEKVEETSKEEVEDIVDIITREPEPIPPPKVKEEFKKEKVNETIEPKEEVAQQEKIPEPESVQEKSEETISEESSQEEKLDEPKKKKEFFIKTLIMGNYSLPMTYWIFYFVIGGILTAAWSALAELPNPAGSTNVVMFALFLITMAYLPVCMIGTWRSAGKYILEKQKAKKSVAWGGLAKFVTVLGWIQYAAVWIMFFIGVAEG
tara:strand:- start:456 stop:1238 length:783 start_codon:yes stop_codon:yes gene_type:complete